jgi:hypothetical protein
MRTEIFEAFDFITGMMHVIPPEDFSENGAILYVDIAAKTKKNFTCQ